MQTVTRKQFWAELEQAGEDVVRDRVIAGQYSDANKELSLAKEWLRLKQRERDQEHSNAIAEEWRDWDRETRHMAESAADTAKSQAKANWVSAIVSVVALLISIVALLRTWRL